MFGIEKQGNVQHISDVGLALTTGAVRRINRRRGDGPNTGVYDWKIIEEYG